MWQATLSDGTIVNEGEGEWSEILGERLPWPRLCAYCRDKNLKVVNLGIFSSEQFWPLPEGEFYSVQYTLEVPNLFASQETIEHIKISAHNVVGGGTYTIFQNMNTGETKGSEVEDFEPMEPSP